MSLTKVTFSMIEGASANVRDFGATGDGVTDDRPAVTAALATLSSGGTLYFPPGDYNMKSFQITDSAIVLPIGVNLLMDGGAWLVSTQGIFDAVSGGSFISPLGDNIIRCNIDGGAYPTSGGVEGTWAVWANVGVRSYFSEAIGLGAENVIVQDSNIKNVSYPIQIYGAKNWRIYGNKFTNYKQSGVLAGYYDGYDCEDNIIENNVFENAGDYAVAFFAVGGEAQGYVKNNTVADNNAYNMNQRTNGYAFGAEQGDRDYQIGFVFANNIYTNDISTAGTTSGGITISTTKDSVVSGNLFIGNGGVRTETGINCRGSINCTIVGNHISDFRGAAINLDSVSTETTENILVANNTCVNSGSADAQCITIARTRSSKHITVTGNYLAWDVGFTRFDANTTAIYTNIATGKTVSDINISNNTIVRYPAYGIAFAGLTASKATRINISGNLLTGGDATLNQQNPLYVVHGEKVNINNNVMQSVYKGIFSRNSDYTFITGNNLYGDTAATLPSYVDITSSTNQIIKDNNFTGTATATISPAATGTNVSTNNFGAP
jgi:hypothetical protein